jgi:hypothetical protein
LRRLPVDEESTRSVERMGRRKGTCHLQPSANVQQVPEIDNDSSSDRHESEETDHLAGDGEGEEDSGEEHPRPPRASELAAKAKRQYGDEMRMGKGRRTNSGACRSGCRSRKRAP